MTFLSPTSDAFCVEPTSYVVAEPARRPRTSAAAHLCAALLLVSAMTVPDAVAQAKWAKAGLVLTILQHRCLASVAA